MSYAPYLTAIGINTDELEPVEVERLGRLAACEVTNTARELALADWKPGEPEVVTAEHYLQALLSLDDEEKKPLREGLMSAPAWWTPACGGVTRLAS